jgi:thioredoxin 1
MSANVACPMFNNELDLKEILKVKDKVFVLFYASWCPFCISFLPIFQKYAEEKGRHFIVVQDDQETIADQYSVKVYPTVLFFKNGIVSKRLDGILGVGLEDEQLVKFVSFYPGP